MLKSPGNSLVGVIKCGRPVEVGPGGVMSMNSGCSVGVEALADVGAAVTSVAMTPLPGVTVGALVVGGIMPAVAVGTITEAAWEGDGRVGAARNTCVVRSDEKSVTSGGMTVSVCAVASPVTIISVASALNGAACISPVGVGEGNCIEVGST